MQVRALGKVGKKSMQCRRASFYGRLVSLGGVRFRSGNDRPRNLTLAAVNSRK